MVIDTSALIAILLQEPEAMDLMQAIVKSEKRIISAFSLLEAKLVIFSRKGQRGTEELDNLLRLIKAEIVDFNEEQVKLACMAWQRFGKGRHSAKLNIGDCCTYALSKWLKEPLLFKGEDFSQTDVEMVKIYS